MLPLGRDEPRLGLGPAAERHVEDLGRIPLIRRLVRVVVLVWVLALLEPANDVKFGVGEVGVLLEKSVGDGGPERERGMTDVSSRRSV